MGLIFRSIEEILEEEGEYHLTDRHGRRSGTIVKTSDTDPIKSGKVKFPDDVEIEYSEPAFYTDSE